MNGRMSRNMKCTNICFGNLTSKTFRKYTINSVKKVNFIISIIVGYLIHSDGFNDRLVVKFLFELLIY